jgi:hypothetical protein
LSYQWQAIELQYFSSQALTIQHLKLRTQNSELVSLPTTSPDYELLLRSGIQAARRGQTSTARALFQAILAEHPDAARVWLALAGVAATREEQLAAIQQALRIEPENEMAQRAMQRLTAGTTSVEPASAAPTPTDDELDLPAVPAVTPQLPPEEVVFEEEEQPDSASAAGPFSRVPGWLVLALLAAALGLALGYFLLPLLNPQQVGQVATATPPLSLTTQPTSVIATTAPLIPTPRPAPQQTAVIGQEPSAPIARSPVATTAPVVPAPLAMGTLQEYDNWSATLLRPDYALSLDGSIGDLQPNGRFVLALLSVSNGDPNPRRMPADLFVVVDQQGRSYQPSAGTSTAYLALFGRGQYGDLAFEDEIAPGGSLFSVPVIFDVPLDATGLLLTMAGNRSAGWQILEGAAVPQNVNTGP